MMLSIDEKNKYNSQLQMECATGNKQNTSLLFVSLHLR